MTSPARHLHVASLIALAVSSLGVAACVPVPDRGLSWYPDCHYSAWTPWKPRADGRCYAEDAK